MSPEGAGHLSPEGAGHRKGRDTGRGGPCHRKGRDLSPEGAWHLSINHFLTGKKNNNPAHPDYTPSIFPQELLKESTKSTKLDRFNRAQKRKAPSTTVSRKKRKVKKQLEFEEETSVPEDLQQEVSIPCMEIQDLQQTELGNDKISDDSVSTITPPAITPQR
ncbi:unnamed protein product [Leuciscus chuanchicus]